MAQTVNGLAQPNDVLRFWFADGNAARWFVRDQVFDAAIRRQFASTVEAAGEGRLHAWTRTPDGWLALLIVLDQVPRNLYRGDARAFACDARALSTALPGLERGDDCCCRYCIAPLPICRWSMLRILRCRSAP